LIYQGVCFSFKTSLQFVSLQGELVGIRAAQALEVGELYDRTA
tara:strand:- start:819 stop:947 length:129 start_codon:yes stop_codon:yes gene_type:complete